MYDQQHSGSPAIATRRHPTWQTSLLAFAVFTFVPASTFAQTTPPTEFRVDSTVYAVKALARDEVLAKNTIYFTATEIINVAQGKNAPVTIIERDSNKITLAEFAQGKKSLVTGEEILRTVAALLARTEGKPAIVQEAANPKFVSDWDEKKSNLRLKGKTLRYDVQAKTPTEVSIVSAYRQFADWSARLNATHPGGLPPTARLMLNAHLAEHSVVPSKVELDRSDLNSKLRSEHKFTMRLTNRDQEAISQIKQRVQALQPVTFVTLRMAGKLPVDESRR